MYASEWTWKVPQVNDDQWHSYKLFVNYPDKVRKKQINFYKNIHFVVLFKIDLYIDDQFIATNNENFRIVEDFPLAMIEDTKGTVFALGACWHGKRN